LTNSNVCPFCNIGSRAIDSNGKAFAIKDRYPVSLGHTLIIPKRHCSDLFQLSEEEILDCLRLLKRQREKLSQTIHPDGFNVGINLGEAAGQSIFHAHIHLIPRFKGDHSNPKGGVRHVIPEKGSY